MKSKLKTIESEYCFKFVGRTTRTSTTLNRIWPVEAIGLEDVLEVERPWCRRGNDVYVFIREREREIEMDDEFLKRLVAGVHWLMMTSTASSASLLRQFDFNDNLIPSILVAVVGSLLDFFAISGHFLAALPSFKRFVALSWGFSSILLNFKRFYSSLTSRFLTMPANSFEFQEIPSVSCGFLSWFLVLSRLTSRFVELAHQMLFNAYFTC